VVRDGFINFLSTLTVKVLKVLQQILLEMDRKNKRKISKFMRVAKKNRRKIYQILLLPFVLAFTLEDIISLRISEQRGSLEN
jgi:hypothetical protein